MLALRALARLLDYPTEETVAALPELRAALAAEPGLDPAAVGPLFDELGAGDLLDRQAAHVATFDRVRTLSLHLFEHAHGDSRARGAAMVDLIELYRRKGLDVTTRELPDYLPLVLEFLSTLPRDDARAHLAETAPILAALRARLTTRGSAWAGAIEALLALAGGAGARPPVSEERDEDDSPEALDRAWEEAAVSFGPERPATDDGCARVARMVERMRPAERGSQR
jgi:nitrate reductase delta subunit